MTIWASFPLINCTFDTVYDYELSPEVALASTLTRNESLNWTHSMSIHQDPAVINSPIGSIKREHRAKGEEDLSPTMLTVQQSHLVYHLGKGMVTQWSETLIESGQRQAEWWMSPERGSKSFWNGRGKIYALRCDGCIGEAGEKGLKTALRFLLSKQKENSRDVCSSISRMCA